MTAASTRMDDMGAYELPRIWFVDSSATEGQDDGTSWTDARIDLQDALTIDAEADDEIWVAAGTDGTYYPDEGDGRNDNDRSETFQLLENVSVYGGFARTEAGLCERKWTDNKTTLSGDIDGDEEPDYNSYHVVVGADNAFIDGFTITGGNADGAPWPDYAVGGGMYTSLDYTSWDYKCLTVVNCIFRDNKNVGMAAWEHCKPIIKNCVFTNNQGGGLSIAGLCYDSAVVANCVFYANPGGGMYLGGAGAKVTNCTFSKNTADYGGAVYVDDYSWLVAKNCIFWGDTGTINTNEIGGPLCCIDVEYSCIDDGYPDDESIPFGGSANHNIDADPDFPIDEPGYEFGPEGEDGIWATADDGLMPGPKSPCINAADFWLPGPRIDTTSRVRTNISPYPDMGAYESKYKIMLVMCFIDETHSQGYYYNLNEYRADRNYFYDLLAGLPYANDPKNFSLLKAGCIVPPYVATGYWGNIGDVLPQSFFNPPAPPEILPPDNELVAGISIAECKRSSTEPTGEELIEHFHRIREGVVPDCIVRLADYTWPLYGFQGLGDGYKDEFLPWLEQWLDWRGLHPANRPYVLPDEVEFTDERWIKAIKENVQPIVNPEP